MQYCNFNDLFRCRSCGYTPHAINCIKDSKKDEFDSSSMFNCPITNDEYEVSLLAPDIELKDMDEKLFINFENIKTEKKLGVGGFAAVYKGIYRDEPVACKTFSSNLDSSVLPYKNLRKELKVLLQV